MFRILSMSFALLYWTRTSPFYTVHWLMYWCYIIWFDILWMRWERCVQDTSFLWVQVVCLFVELTSFFLWIFGKSPSWVRDVYLSNTQLKGLKDQLCNHLLESISIGTIHLMIWWMDTFLLDDHDTPRKWKFLINEGMPCLFNKCRRKGNDLNRLSELCCVNENLQFLVF